MTIVRISVGVAVMAGLYLTSLYSYNLFHGLAELFGVVVAAGVFVVAWNTRTFSTNNYILLLGCAFIFVAVVDTLHTLAYQGLQVFSGYTTDLPTQLWLVGRYLYLIALLIAPFLIGRRARAGWYLAGFAALTAVLLILVFTGLFPTAYVPGEGLTAFKIISEYTICVLLLLALWLLWRKRQAFESQVFYLLVASILATIASELLFTLYISPFGPTNLAGHFLKIIALYLVYKAVIETALMRPYTLLFRELKDSEEAMREKEREQRHIADVLQEALLMTPESVPGLAFGHVYHPATVAGKVGGDFYDLFALGSRSVGILIGDVSGHGIEAAAFTSLAKDTIKAFAFEGQTPAAALAKANVATSRRAAGRSGTRFLTAFYGILDLDEARLQYSVAGHPPGMIRRVDGRVEVLEAGSPVIGVFPDAPYRDFETRFEHGDVLFLYTDGLTECRADSHFFGEERVRDAVAALSLTSASELPGLVYQEAISFCRGNLLDDVAILALSLDES